MWFATVCLLSRYRLSNLCLPRISRACYSLQSAVERALPCSRSLSLIRETGDQWIAASREISLTVRWLWRVFLTRHSATATSLCRHFDQYVPCVVCRAPWRMSTVPNFLNFTSSLLMLFFVQPLSGNSVRNKLPSVVTFTFITDFRWKFWLLYWTAPLDRQCDA